MHAKHFTYFVFTYLIATMLSGSAFSADLLDTVREALQFNPNIGAAKAAYYAADAELQQSRGQYLPQIDVVAGTGPEWTSDTTTRVLGDDPERLTRSDARVQLTQRVFTGFEVSRDIDRQKARSEATAIRVFQTAQNTALDAISAHLEVALQRELYALAEKNVAFHRDTLKKLEQRLAAGASTKADVAQTRARLARADATLADVGNALGDAESFFVRIVGSHPEKLVINPFPISALPSDISGLETSASKNAPAVRAAEFDVAAANADIGFATSNYYPKINLEADSGYVESGAGRDTYGHDSRVMLRGRWNIFRGGIDNAAREEATHRLIQVREDRLRNANESIEEARRAWYAHHAGMKRITQLEQAVDDLTQSRDAYIQQFDIGERTLLDLLNAENELFITRGALVTAWIGTMRAGYRVLASDGRLLATLDVDGEFNRKKQ
jgi:adhesin transport system outer membrane protein